MVRENASEHSGYECAKDSRCRERGQAKVPLPCGSCDNRPDCNSAKDVCSIGHGPPHFSKTGSKSGPYWLVGSSFIRSEAAYVLPSRLTRLDFFTVFPARNAFTSLAVKVILLRVFSFDFFQITKQQPDLWLLQEKPKENSVTSPPHLGHFPNTTLSSPIASLNPGPYSLEGHRPGIHRPRRFSPSSGTGAF